MTHCSVLCMNRYLDASIKYCLKCWNHFTNHFAFFIVPQYFLRWCRLSWGRHQMESFFTLLAFCVGNSLVIGEFPSQRPVSRSFDVLFDLRLNKWLSKQSWGWWFETPSCPLWCHCNDCNDPCILYSKYHVCWWPGNIGNWDIGSLGVNLALPKYCGFSTRMFIWVRSCRCASLVNWFCYQMTAKPGNRTDPPSWPDLYHEI